MGSSHRGLPRIEGARVTLFLIMAAMIVADVIVYLVLKATGL